MGYKKKIFFALMAGIIGLCYAGISSNMCVSWIYPYHNFTAMYQDSDIIIRGVQRASFQPHVFKLETYHQITILEMIKGEKPAHVISVPQMGGYYLPGKMSEPASFPLYRRGDELILFLKRSKKPYPGYLYNGGPQGSYKILDGKVYPSGTIGYQSINSNGADVNTFIDYIKSLE